MRIFVLLFLLVACETPSDNQNTLHELPTGTTDVARRAPEIEDVEEAYKQERYSWIATRFAGPENTLMYRELYTDHWTWQYVGFAFLKSEDYLRATAAFRRVMEIKPKFSPAIYNLACVAALTDKQDQALELIQLLATRVQGYQSLKTKYRQMIQTDEDFAMLRSHPRFATTLSLFK